PASCPARCGSAPRSVARRRAPALGRATPRAPGSERDSCCEGVRLKSLNDSPLRECCHVSRGERSDHFLATAVSGREKMTTAEVPLPPKKPDTTPEVVATYCLPPSS